MDTLLLRRKDADSYKLKLVAMLVTKQWGNCRI